MRWTKDAQQGYDAWNEAQRQAGGWRQSSQAVGGLGNHCQARAAVLGLALQPAGCKVYWYQYQVIAR